MGKKSFHWREKSNRVGCIAARFAYCLLCCKKAGTCLARIARNDAIDMCHT